MKEEDDIVISRYLADELGPPELAAFETRLAAEPPLAAELQRRQQELTFLRTEAALPGLEAEMARLAGTYFRSDEEEARTQVQAPPSAPEARPPQGDGTKQQGGAKVRSLNWQRWLPAAGVAAAIALVLLLWNPFADKDPYRQFAQHAPLYLTEKSSDPAPAAAAAEAAFNAANYPAAYNELTAYLRQRPDDNEARLALGIAALETNRDTEAQAIFTELANGTTTLQDDGQFYLALAYFKAGDSRARAALEKISPENPDFGVRAGQMLQLLP